ncbi:stage II sporulation protein M [Caldalkalibacillus mannanilyticus]|uniref:stage II sporulation protein M n=1 Tax=Caldalkalibacillus mannanilyticus TaxID=1418 RepID=UPI00046AAE59|nr:stage II sporulation protein M [Caldalkalibacillus mannanilyticus]
MLNVVNKTVFKRAIHFFIFGVALTVIFTIITFIINPDPKEILEKANTRIPDFVKESEGIYLVWAYIVNNGFMVPLQMLILALLPIQYLYVINIITTVVFPGILFGIVLHVNFKTGVEIIISTIPHYSFEVFAFCLFAAILFELNKAIRIKIRNLYKKDKVELPLIKKFLETIKVYVVLSLPLLIIAAFLETYIPHIIFNLFQ